MPVYRRDDHDVIRSSPVVFRCVSRDISDGIVGVACETDKDVKQQDASLCVTFSSLKRLITSSLEVSVDVNKQSVHSFCDERILKFSERFRNVSLRRTQSFTPSLSEQSSGHPHKAVPTFHLSRSRVKCNVPIRLNVNVEGQLTKAGGHLLRSASIAAESYPHRSPSANNT